MKPRHKLVLPTEVVLVVEAEVIFLEGDVLTGTVRADLMVFQAKMVQAMVVLMVPAGAVHPVEEISMDLITGIILIFPAQVLHLVETILMALQ